MKQFSVVLIFLVVYIFSLFSCIGVQPTTSVQEDVNTSPLQQNSVTTDKSTSAIDPACEAVIQDVAINAEGEIISEGEVRCVNPAPVKKSTSVTKKLSIEEQAAVATALAYLGDKAPYLEVESVSKRKVGYEIHFKQVYQGISVELGRIIIAIEPNQPPRVIRNSYNEGVTISSITPTLTLEDAVAIGLKNIGITDSYRIASEFNKLQIIKVPTKNQAKKGTKTPIEDKPQKYVLAWSAKLTLKCPTGDWNIWIEANTGDVLGFVSGERWDPGPPPTPNCPIRFVPPTAAPSP